MPGAARSRGLSRERQRQALGTLHVPIPLYERRHLPGDEEVLRIFDRTKAHQQVANPYQRDFTLFKTHLCYTKDEAAGGIVRRMPDWEYLREFDRRLIEEPLLLVEKSRRVLATWNVCCFDIWVAAGGQDPRWLDHEGRPVLMRSRQNRQVILAARKLEDPGGSAWFLETRVRFILEQFEERGFRRYWPEFPSWKATFSTIEFAGTGRIDAIPQGAHQARGAGATLLHIEELAFWEQQQASINAMLPVLRGGGHMVAVTTPQVGTYAAKIVRGDSARHRWRGAA